MAPAPSKGMKRSSRKLNSNTPASFCARLVATETECRSGTSLYVGATVYWDYDKSAKALTYWLFYPGSGSPQERDFQRINPLLRLVEGRVKQELVTEALRDFDVALGDVDDVIAMWNVERAREAAWTHAFCDASSGVL
jgi:hypothetical protein